jgi:indolepyruvate ferredoxin oxidoreductase
LATALMGDAVATNVFVLGYAWQKGWVPLLEASLMQAIEINGAAVAMNRAAFAWGRQAALDLDTVRTAAGLKPGGVVIAMPPRTLRLEEVLADRIQRLTDWQNAAYAERYQQFVRNIARIEHERTGEDRFSREVAVSLFKLMAFKDEYEVARLYTETGFLDTLKERFTGDFSPRFHLAPPLLARKDANGHLVKKTYGPWMLNAMRWLAKARVVRGTLLDPFRYTAISRADRQAIADYEVLVSRLVGELDTRRRPLAQELARLPQTVRGFGHVKDRNAEIALEKQAELLARWELPVSEALAA